MNMIERIVRWPELRERTGLSRSTVWRKIKEKDFPPPVKLTDHAVGWRQSDLDAWLASRQKAG